jgi:hypothetical protein
MLGHIHSNIIGYGDHESAVCPSCAVEEYGSAVVERVRLGLVSQIQDTDPVGIPAFDLLDGARCAECGGFFPTIRQANGLDNDGSL